MKIKKSMIFVCLIIGLLSMVSVYASDVNDTVVANDNQIDILNEQDSLIEIESQKNNELENTPESTSVGTFTDLANEIYSGDNEIILKKDYAFNSSIDSRININEPISIDGNGHTIDASESEGIFYISSDNVVLKNIKIVFNMRTESFCGILSRNVDNINIINCTFENCNLKHDGDWGSCNFIAIIGHNNKISDCNFINIDFNGVDTINNIIEIEGDNNTISYCKFINCKGHDMSIILITSSWEENILDYIDSQNCSIYNCVFNNITLGEFERENYVVDCYGNYCRITNCSFNEITGNTIYFNGENGIINDCIFINTTTNSDTYYGYNDDNGGSIYINNNNGIIDNCIFINSIAIDKGGAIYSSGENVTINNCSFFNSTAILGKSIFIISGIVNNSYFDNEDENNCFIYKDAKLIKKTPTLTLNDITFNYNNPSDYKIALKCNDVVLNDKKIIVELIKDDYHANYDFITSENGIINIAPLLKNLDVGTWTIKASYFGGDNYENVIKTATIKINPISPLVILEDISTTVNQETIINAVINRPDSVIVNSGVVNFYAGDKLIGSSIVVNNMAYITYCPSNEGNFTLKAVFEDSNSLSSNNISNLVVNPEIPKINLNQNISDENNHIMFELPTDATGIVTIIISGNVYTAVADGKVNVDLSDLLSGDYPYTLSYSGDAKYASFTRTGNINVNTTENVPIEPEITISSLDNTSEDECISVSLPEDATGTITLTINNKNYYFAIINGKANLLIPNLENGNYKCVISYSGDEKYSSLEKTDVIVINKTVVEPSAELVPIVLVIPSLDYASSDGTVEIKLPEDATGTITFTIKDKEYYFAVINGVANIIIPNLDDGNYPYTINYSGDSKYLSYTTSGNLKMNKTAETPQTIEKINTVITTSPISSTYNEEDYLVATLKDSQGNIISGKTISVYLNGVKTLITDINGQVKLPTIDLDPNSYVAVISFEGDNNYNGAFTIGDVTINKATVKLTAKAKTFKSNVKIKKYSITLKTTKNKAIAKTIVTLKVNGKTFKATTNNNGKATFKITKLTTKGTFKATVKFAGDKYFNAKTVKPKITIK